MISFDLASSEDVIAATSRSFGFLIEQRLDRFRDACAHLRVDWSIPDTVSKLQLEDEPRLRHWIASTHEITLALIEGRDPSAEATLHFSVDDAAPQRLIELHLIRLAEIALDHCKRKSIDIEFGIPFQKPMHLSLGRSRLVVREDEAAPGSWAFGANHGVVFCESEEGKITSADRISPPGHLVRQGLFIPHQCNGADVPIHDPALTSSGLAGSPVLVGRRTTEAWLDLVSDALDSLDRARTGLGSECLSLCRSILPLHNGATSFGSCSPARALGLVFLPAVNRVYDIAECLFHEAMHQKLYRIDEATAIFEPNSPRGEIYYSPWRPEPRPLEMVLHGAYVFSGVAELWLKWFEVGMFEADRAVFNCALRARQALSAHTVIARNATLSPIGLRVFDAIKASAESVLATVRLSEASRRQIEAILSEHRGRYGHYTC
jgi:HEXXH motif-containing protein